MRAPDRGWCIGVKEKERKVEREKERKGEREKETKGER